MRSLLLFAQDLGLDEETMREIYEAVGRETMVTDASDDDRMAEVRKRLIAVAESEEERPWCVVRLRERGYETKKPRPGEPGGAGVERD